MKVIEYNELLVILNDLKKAGKRIGEFYTTGKLHEGHLVGIKKIKEQCDVVIVLFNQYYKTIYFQLTGSQYHNLYEEYFLDDLKILEDNKIVDYVSVMSYSEEIYDRVIEKRKQIVKDINFFKQFKWLPLDRNRECYLDIVARLSMTTIINPEEYFCDVNLFGDKNFICYVAQMYCQKTGVPIKYDFYPIVKDLNDEPYSSISTCSNKYLKDEIKYSFKKCIENGEPIKSGNVRVDLIDSRTMFSVDKMKSGRMYFVYGVTGSTTMPFSFNIERVMA